MNRWLWLALLAGLNAMSAGAHVTEFEDHLHEPGRTYTSIGLAGGQVRILYTVPRADLAALAGSADEAVLRAAVDAGFVVENAGSACQHTRTAVDDYAAIAAWQFELDYECSEALDFIRVYYDLIDDRPAHGNDHRNYVEVFLGAQVLQLVLDERQRRVDVPVAHLAWERGPAWAVPEAMPELPGKKPSLYRYFESGFLHVLEGYDHLAFVLGLVLVLVTWTALAITITAFTIAHSVTLGISAGGFFVVSPSIIEPLIALSIAWIGIENLWLLWRRRRPTDPGDGGSALPGSARRWPVAFGFGLAHGFGFSYMLRDLGLPEGEFLISLALFNIGVEVGQLCVVLLPFFALSLLHARGHLAEPVRVLGSIAVAVLGLWLLGSRILEDGIVGV